MPKRGHRPSAIVEVQAAPSAGAPQIPARRGRPRRLPGPIGLAAYAAQVGGIEVFMEIARLSGDKLIRNVLAIWDDISDSVRDRVRLESLLEQVGMAPEDFLAELVRAGHRCGVAQAAIVQGLGLPLVVEATVNKALKGDGHREKRLIYQSSGMLPSPRNSFTAIRGQNIQVNQQPAAPGLPTMEEENAVDVMGRAR